MNGTWNQPIAIYHRWKCGEFLSTYLETGKLFLDKGQIVKYEVSNFAPASSGTAKLSGKSDVLALGE